MAAGLRYEKGRDCRNGSRDCKSTHGRAGAGMAMLRRSGIPHNLAGEAYCFVDAVNGMITVPIIEETKLQCTTSISPVGNGGTLLLEGNGSWAERIGEAVFESFGARAELRE